MLNDVRYKATSNLIKTQSITEFEEVFHTLPKSTLAKALRKNTSRIDDIINNPTDLRYKDIKQMSQLLDVPCSMIIRLFDKDFT